MCSSTSCPALFYFQVVKKGQPGNWAVMGPMISSTQVSFMSLNGADCNTAGVAKDLKDIHGPSS